MKKALGILAGLLVVVLAGLPPWFGQRAEDAVRAQAADESFGGDYLEFRLVEYDRGLYGSTATMEIGLDSSYVELVRSALRADTSAADTSASAELDQITDDLTIRFTTDFAHGPVGFEGGPFVGLARGEMRPELPDGLLDRWRDEIDASYLFRVRHQIGFGGASRFEVVVPPIDIRRDGTRMTLTGWEAWVEYEPASGELAFRAAIDTLAFSDDETDLRLESLRADAEGTIAAPRLLVGGGGLRIERFSLLRPYEAIVRTDMVGFDASGDTEISDDGSVLSSSSTYTVDSMIVGDAGLGEAELTMAVRNIDREAAERWSTFSEGAALQAEEMDEEAIREELGALVYDFLVAGPELEVDPARFQYDGQPFRASLRLRADPSALPDREDFEVMARDDLQFWTSLFSAEADFEASRSLARTIVVRSQVSMMSAQLEQSGRSVSEQQLRAMAEQQADALLSGLVEEGYVSEEGDRLVSRLGYDDSELSANGQALPIPGR